MKRIALFALALSGCTSTVNSMMSSYCDLSDEDWSPDPHNDGDPTPPIGCDYTKAQVLADGTCRHAGGHWGHNWATDFWGNQLFPDSGPHTAGGVDDYGWGCDAQFVTGGAAVLLDGLIKAAQSAILVFEMKVGNYTKLVANSCPDIIKDKIKNSMREDFQKSAAKEKPIADRCGYKYQMVFADPGLYEQANNYFNGSVDTQVCQQCINFPSKPSTYAVGNSFPITSTGFTRFWLDSHGTLVWMHFAGNEDDL